MPDEAVAVLQEIAGLLRRRVEQTDEATRSRPDVAKIRLDNEKRLVEIKTEMGQRREHNQQQAQQIQEEERQFKQQLLVEMQRHNALLEQLLSRLSR